MIKVTDKEIISALKSRENVILREVYRVYKEEFKAWAYKTYKADEVEDVFQEAFATLILNAERGKLNDLKGRLKSYFFAIAKFKLFKSLKEDRLVTVDISGFHQEAYSEEIHYEEGVFALNDSQMRMKEILESGILGKCETLLKMIFYENFSTRDIVKKLGLSNVNTLKSRKYRCLEKLRTEYLKHTYREDEREN